MIWDAMLTTEGRTERRAAGMIPLAVLYQAEITDKGEPHEGMTRALARSLGRTHDTIVLDLEDGPYATMTDREGTFVAVPAAFDRIGRVVRWVKSAAPHVRVGLYNLPYAERPTNLDADNKWVRGWLWQAWQLSRQPWWPLVDCVCPDLYPYGPAMTLEEFKQRADVSLATASRVAGKAIGPVFVRPDYHANGTPAESAVLMPWYAAGVAHLLTAGYEPAAWSGDVAPPGVVEAVLAAGGK